MKGFHTLLFGNSPMDPGTRYDAIIVGGGHNGLTAAAYLAKAGKSVLVLERRTETSYKVGEATVASPANLDRLTHPGRNFAVNLVWDI